MEDQRKVLIIKTRLNLVLGYTYILQNLFHMPEYKYSMKYIIEHSAYIDQQNMSESSEPALAISPYIYYDTSVFCEQLPDLTTRAYLYTIVFDKETINKFREPSDMELRALSIKIEPGFIKEYCDVVIQGFSICKPFEGVRNRCITSYPEEYKEIPLTESIQKVIDSGLSGDNMMRIKLDQDEHYPSIDEFITMLETTDSQNATLI